MNRYPPPLVGLYPWRIYELRPDGACRSLRQRQIACVSFPQVVAARRQKRCSVVCELQVHIFQLSDVVSYLCVDSGFCFGEEEEHVD